TGVQTCALPISVRGAEIRLPSADQCAGGCSHPRDARKPPGGAVGADASASSELEYRRGGGPICRGWPAPLLSSYALMTVFLTLHFSANSSSSHEETRSKPASDSLCYTR